MNTVFCIQQKANRNQTFQKMGISSGMIPAYGLIKERITFFAFKRQILCCVRTKRTKKRAPHKKAFFSHEEPDEKRLFFRQHFTSHIYERLGRRGKFPRGQGNAKRNGMGRV